MRSQNGRWPAIGSVLLFLAVSLAAGDGEHVSAAGPDISRSAPGYSGIVFTQIPVARVVPPRRRQPESFERRTAMVDALFCCRRTAPRGCSRLTSRARRIRRFPSTAREFLRSQENRGRPMEHLRNEGRRVWYSPNHPRRGKLPEPHVPVGPVLPQRCPAILPGHFRQRCCRRAQRIRPSASDEPLFSSI